MKRFRQGIPAYVRAELLAKYDMSQSVVSGFGTKLQWHHHLKFAGRAVQASFCIFAVTKDEHDEIWKHKALLDRLMWERATEEEREKYKLKP